jgi:hypothetical protein
MFQPNKIIEEQITQFKLVSIEAKKSIEYLNSIRNIKNIQHTVIIISFARVIQYFDAYIELVERGFVEPSATLLRSIYHTVIWMRWSLLSDNNAQIYFNIGQQELKRILNKLTSKKIVNFGNTPNQEETKTILKEITSKIPMPQVSDMAIDVGYGEYHALTYNTLSAISHGSLMFFDENKNISYLPNGNDIEKYFELANNFFLDCILISEEFIKNGTIRKVPDILKLTGF